MKEIKVRIPVNFHLKLHAFKVLKGKPISDTIVEALDAYFKAAEHRRREPGTEAGMPGAVEGMPPRAAEPLGGTGDEPPRRTGDQPHEQRRAALGDDEPAPASTGTAGTARREPREPAPPSGPEPWG